MSLNVKPLVALILVFNLGCASGNRLLLSGQQLGDVLDAKSNGQPRVELQEGDGSTQALVMEDWRESTVAVRAKGVKAGDAPLQDLTLVRRPEEEPQVEAWKSGRPPSLRYRVELSQVEAAELYQDHGTRNAVVVSSVVVGALLVGAAAVAGGTALALSNLRF